MMHLTVSHQLASLIMCKLLIVMSLVVQRVRKMALRLARSTRPQPDLLVVELAALLHDITDKKYVSIDPQTVLMPFFSDIRCHLDLIKDGRAKLVIKIVENVSWTTEKNLRAGGNWTEWHDTCPELHCVQDADRLDAIGAVGECLSKPVMHL